MKKVKKLVNGVYLIYWKEGGTSVAAVGTLPDGNRWLAPTNWIAPSTKSSVWRLVEKVELITTK